jgi:predicted nucleic acid-binding protein
MNALSAIADGDPKLAPWIETAAGLVIPVIALGEYKYGIRQSRFGRDMNDGSQK